MDDEQAKKLAQHLNRSVVLERAEAALNAVLSAPVNAGAEALQMLGWIKRVEDPKPSEKDPKPE